MTVLTMEIEACLVFRLLLASDSRDKLTLFRKDGPLARSLTSLPACMWELCNWASLTFTTTAVELEWQETFLQTLADSRGFFCLSCQKKFLDAEVCAAYVCHQQITAILLVRHRRNMNLGPCSKNYGSFLCLQSGTVTFQFMLIVKIQKNLFGKFVFGKLVYVVITMTCGRFFRCIPLVVYFLNATASLSTSYPELLKQTLPDLGSDIIAMKQTK